MISDFTVVKQTHVVLAIGNGEVIVLRLNGENGISEELARDQICDIKLLSCFTAAIQEISGDTQFDILASNGRSELIKATFDG